MLLSISCWASRNFSLLANIFCICWQNLSKIIPTLINSRYAIGFVSLFPLKNICAPSSVTMISIFVTLSIFSIISLQKIQFMFPILPVAYMRCHLVHCPATLTTLVLPMLGKFVAVFSLAHTYFFEYSNTFPTIVLTISAFVIVLISPISSRT